MIENSQPDSAAEQPQRHERTGENFVAVSGEISAGLTRQTFDGRPDRAELGPGHPQVLTRYLRGSCR